MSYNICSVSVRIFNFNQQEVFKSEIHESVSFDKVIGRCLVLHVQQIFDYQPLVSLSNRDGFYIIILSVISYKSINTSACIL